MFKLIALLVCLSAISAQSFQLFPRPRPRLDGRIVGGIPVDIKEIAYQISLQRNGYHMCGGALISKSHVLTAAHCTSGQTASTLKVRLGSTRTVDGGVLVGVKKLSQHSKYNSQTIDYDFSVLELEAYNSENLTIEIAKLPAQDSDIPDGTLLRVSGWGNTQNSAESTSALRAAIVPKVNQERCSKNYYAYGGVTDRMICAGYDQGGKDACQGDSGGPLAVNNTLIGVVSWGVGCARPDYPGVYGRVASVRSWIQEVSGI